MEHFYLPRKFSMSPSSVSSSPYPATLWFKYRNLLLPVFKLYINAPLLHVTFFNIMFFEVYSYCFLYAVHTFSLMSSISLYEYITVWFIHSNFDRYLSHLTIMNEVATNIHALGFCGEIFLFFLDKLLQVEYLGHRLGLQLTL